MIFTRGPISDHVETNDDSRADMVRTADPTGGHGRYGRAWPHDKRKFSHKMNIASYHISQIADHRSQISYRKSPLHKSLNR